MPSARRRIDARACALVALLALRIFLGLGPDSIVVCIHGDGAVNVESTTDLCCQKGSCLATRSDATALAPTSPGSDGEDDCVDFSFTTSTPSVVDAPSADAVTGASLLGEPAPGLTIELAPVDAGPRFSWRARTPGDPRHLETVFLRC